MPTNFQKKVFFLVKKIPKGKVKTYKEIAKELDSHPRAVGKALNANQNLIKIPCHRVIRSDGKIEGYKLEPKKKIDLLKKEGIKIQKGKIIN